MEAKALSQIHDVGEFLTDSMVNIIQRSSYDRDDEADIFQRTFGNISDNYGSDAFRRYDTSKKKHMGGFLLSAYEVIAIGLGYHRGELPRGRDDVGKRIRAMWSNETFKEWSGSGVRASSRIPKLIPLGRKLFKS